MRFRQIAIKARNEPKCRPGSCYRQAGANRLSWRETPFAGRGLRQAPNCRTDQQAAVPPGEHRCAGGNRPRTGVLGSAVHGRRKV